MTVARTEQTPIRTVTTTDAKARTEQTPIRVVSSNFLHMRAEQVPIRVVSENVPNDAGGRRRQMAVCN